LKSRDLAIPQPHLEDRSEETDASLLDDNTTDFLLGSPLLDCGLGPEHVPTELGKLEILEPFSELLGVKTLALRLRPSTHEVIGRSRTCWAHSGAYRVQWKLVFLGASSAKFG
jgi:hypothetical protein